METEDDSDTQKLQEIVLRPNRNLLDPDFETYKLDSRSLPVFSQNINIDLDRWEFPLSFHTSQHVKAYGSHNHLFADPWDPAHLFFFDSSLQLHRVAFVRGRQLESPRAVIGFPPLQGDPGERVHADLVFPSAKLACLSDGAGRVLLAETGERDRAADSGEDEVWEVLFCGSPLPEKVPFLLCHAIAVEDAVHLVTVRVLERRPDEDIVEERVRAAIEWITLTVSPDGCSVSRTRRLEGRHVPSFLHLMDGGTQLMACAESPLNFVFDSAVPVTPPSEEEAPAKNGEAATKDGEPAAQKERPVPLFLWSQTQEEMSLRMPARPAAFTKKDVTVKMERQRLHIQIDGIGEVGGELFLPTIADDNTWMLAADGDLRQLEVTLAKSDEACWPRFFSSEANDLGLEEELFDANAAAAKDTQERQGVNSLAQTEECDDCSERQDFCYLLDGERHCTSLFANLSSNQWLCSDHLQPAGRRSLCVRHDVDGIVWEPSPLSATGDEEGVCGPLRHALTFNALGYLWAAKASERQFSGHAPDGRYAAYCGLQRHVHIYRQPQALPEEMELRNRKTGRSVASVARHHVVSLSASENIIGMRCSPEAVFLLTRNSLFAVGL